MNKKESMITWVWLFIVTVLVIIAHMGIYWLANGGGR